VDPPTFRLLCDSLRAHVQATPGGRSGRPGRVRILSEDVDYLRANLSGRLGRTLVRLPDGGLTLEDALEDLRFYDFTVRSLDPQAFAIALNSHLEFMVERDLLAGEAIRQHLDRLPEVTHELETWTDAWRATALERTLGTPVGIDHYVAALAARSHVRVELARAQAMNLPPPRMITRRVLGFGGGMLAAPTALPLWGWVPVWRAATPALP
jgi:hypothetical protein